MKALSIKQPWASLIVHGIKDIENRTWRTHFRGRIYIHASGQYIKAKTGWELLSSEQIDSLDKENLIKYLDQSYPVSAIIGEVEIIDCVQDHESIWAEKTLTKPNINDYRNEFGGNMELYKHNLELWKNSKPIYNWVLANPILYEKPILNVKGKLSFWEPDIDIVECIGCSQKFDSETMEEDDVNEKYCTECWKELAPIMQQEYLELKAKGEID